MTTATILAFLWTSLLVELTPGPNMTYLALLSIKHGARAALAAVAGVAVGLTLIGFAATLGFGALIEQSALLYEAVRWAGVAYLLWLAYDAWRDAGASAASLEDVAAGRLFRDGLLTNLLNPKAVVFYVTVLPAFADPTQPLLRQTIGLTVLYVAVATAVHVSIVFVAERAVHFMGDGRIRMRLGRALAFGLVAVAAWLAWSTRR